MRLEYISEGTVCLLTANCPGRMASELRVGTSFVPQPLKYMQLYGRKWKDISSKDLGSS